ncbi:hypothetical protein [Metabacillus litoralis]|uniref:hypothetical protein n=1 Tax=Metabacillus litoralis TaxID=152268 RepID=UPI001CFE2A76|nr:hypothetical protein [Metabacillus litoralis]
MNSKIIMFFQYLYKFFQVSIYFWISLLKGFVVYSIVPSFCALFLTLHHLNRGEDDEKNISVRKLFKQQFELHKTHKIVSFTYTFILMLLYAFLYFVNKQGNDLTIVMSVVLIYLLVLTLLMLTFSTVFLSFKKQPIKLANIHAFLAIIKNPVSSIAILALFILMYLAADYNFAFFVFFGPFLYGFGVIYSLYKHIEID